MYSAKLHSGRYTKYKFNHMSGLHPCLLTTFKTEIAQQNTRNRTGNWLISKRMKSQKEYAWLLYR